ncbi:phage tail protein [Pseudomonas sp. MWU349]|uniref:phage tail-collar fiber domain-containing protein n=1 Tax=Pseudomonas sp. MWU349 TaxID=2802572 RepID=UPI001B322FFC|nr:phage tail protein [Pseudomonas sp. MWU349]
MVDQNSQFYAILTNVGAAKQANADALGIPWKITQMGVGDANGTDPAPNATQTALISEWRRAPLNQLKVDDKDSSIIIAEQVIPADVGGRWIREIALYDADGDMIAVANCAPTYKPLLSQGSGRTQIVRMNLIVSSSSNVQLKIDPSVVLATREYVDAAILAVLPRNKPAGTYGKVTIDARGIVTGGESPVTLAGHGIADAFTMAETNQKVADAISTLRGPVPANLDQLSKIAASLNNDPQFSANMLLALAGKASKGTTLGEYGIIDAIPNRNPIANGMDVYGGDLAFLTANAEASIALNCYYTGQKWLRRDTTKSAICLGVSRSQGLFVARADAGTGPIAWTSSGLLDSSLAFTKDEVLTLLADRLKAGDFGLGGYAPLFPGNDLNKQYDGTSWFRTIAGCLNAPPGANTQGSQVRHEVLAPGVTQQTFREHLTAREWHRASDAYAFGPWIEVVTNMVGAVQAFASTVPPTGWLVADGSQVLRANYPALLAAINGAFGWGNGSTTFNLPDMRGEVIRGLDLGRGINPGRALGSIELDAMQGHGHANTNQIIGMSGGSGEFLSHNNGISSSTSTTRILGPVDLAGYGAVRVASETRMRNVAMLWCIKY